MLFVRVNMYVGGQWFFTACPVWVTADDGLTRG